MPPAVAVAAITAGAAAGSHIIGARMQSKGATLAAQAEQDAAIRAAEIQAQAAREAADAQERAQAETLRFQREQAQREWEQQEAIRRANYDQWAARERRLGSFAEQLGYGRNEIPPYAPTVDPRLTNQPNPSGPGPIINDPHGPITRPDVYPGGGLPPTSTTMPVPSVRDALWARRFPAGSVGAQILAARRRPEGLV